MCNFIEPTQGTVAGRPNLSNWIYIYIYIYRYRYIDMNIKETVNKHKLAFPRFRDRPRDRKIGFRNPGPAESKDNLSNDDSVQVGINDRLAKLLAVNCFLVFVAFQVPKSKITFIHALLRQSPYMYKYIYIYIFIYERKRN